MEEKKTFKQFRDDVRKRKVRRRSKRDATNHPSQGQQQVPQQKGTRLGGSTSVLLPEPRARTMAKNHIEKSVACVMHAQCAINLRE